MLPVSLCALVTLCALGFLGCETKPSRNPFDPPATATKPAPKVTEPPKPQGPPELKVDSHGPKVGWTLLIIDKPEGRQKFTAEIQNNRQHFEGQEVTVSVDRAAQSPHVVAMLDELYAVKASHIKIATSTRAEFPPALEFVPQQRLKDVASCSVVMMILKDRSTAVWKLSGGTASRRGKGLAGPDLSMTGETIKRYAKHCDESSTMFVSGAEDVEWGLVFDLAGSAQRIEGVKWSKLVLLREPPVAGRPVSLK
jgi:biopolymer transport protein ExbD